MGKINDLNTAAELPLWMQPMVSEIIGQLREEMQEEAHRLESIEQRLERLEEVALLIAELQTRK